MERQGILIKIEEQQSDAHIDNRVWFCLLSVQAEAVCGLGSQLPPFLQFLI